MSRRVIERNRRAAAGPEPEPAKAVNYELEFGRVALANTRLQVRVAELELQLARRTGAAKAALDKAQRKLDGARTIAAQAEKGLARFLADSLGDGATAKAPKAPRKRKPAVRSDASRPPRKTVRKAK